MRYNVVVEIEQEARKTLFVELEAQDEEDVQWKLHEMLKTYPREIYENGIYRVQPRRTHYNAPTALSITEMREVHGQY